LHQIEIHEDQRDGDEWVVLTNGNEDVLRANVRPTGDRRRNITSHLEQQGIIRPIPY